MDLEGRDVVITGAAGGLGGAVVDAFLAAGAVCHLPVHSGADRLSKRVGSNARARIVAGVDLTDEGAVAAFYAGCPSLWGSVHLAGGFQGGGIGETSLADLRRQIDINLVTAFSCCRSAVRNMRDKGAGRGGCLVNVSARSAALPPGDSVAYTVAKGCVATLTRALAAELFVEGIRVNAILPSTIDTPANRAAMPGADHGRWVKAADVAGTIVWLVSEGSGATSGALVPVGWVG